MDEKGVKGKEKKEVNVWTDECEELLAEWSEKASCYRWLHGRCEKSYRTWYYCFSIPVIILSTLTGAANVGMDSFVPEDAKSLCFSNCGRCEYFCRYYFYFTKLFESRRTYGGVVLQVFRQVG